MSIADIAPNDTVIPGPLSLGPNPGVHSNPIAAGIAATGGDKTVNSTVNNTVNIVAPDPHGAAAMVGVNLDRSAADVARNLGGALQ